MEELDNRPDAEASGALTDRQKRFCEEYILDLNATAAAERAGYSDPNYGRQILTIPNVLDYITLLQQARSERTQITADRVLKGQAKIGFSDIKNYVTSNWQVKPLDEIPPEDTAAIQSIKTTVDEGTTLDGKALWKKTRVEFKLHPKQPALESLAKHLNLYTDKTPPGNLPPLTEEDETGTAQ